MTKQQLVKELEKVSALRENRIRVSNLVLDSVNCIEHLVAIAFEVEEKVSIKAAWVLEFIVKKKVSFIFPFLDTFTQHIAKVHFGGAVRSMAKITQLLVEKDSKQDFLTKKQKETMVETSFDWMLSKHKVAIKAYSMRTLFLLGRDHDWVHKELQVIIKNNSHQESSAYKSRGRITLEQIKKYNHS